MIAALTNSTRLQVRQGTLFACTGRGLCCSDVHSLGPVLPSDLERLRQVADVSLPRDSAGRAMLPVNSDGYCVFRRDGCELHGRHGIRAKPSACRSFPFGVVAIGEVSRVVTSHRCPCRTLGLRQEVDAAAALPYLDQPTGELAPVVRIHERIPLTRRTRVSLSTWESIEQPILRRLLRGEEPTVVLESKPDVARYHKALPELRQRAAAGTARGFLALGHFVDGLDSLAGADVPLRSRPWASAFEDPAPPPAEVTLGDFLADFVWALGWSQTTSFAAFKVELATVAQIARHVAERSAEGPQVDGRQMAEAVFIIETAMNHPAWRAASRHASQSLALGFGNPKDRLC